jgi:hypothetical protein
MGQAIAVRTDLREQNDRLEPALRLLVDVAISFSGLLFANSGRRWRSVDRDDR